MTSPHVRRRRTLVAVVLLASLLPVARAAAGSQGSAVQMPQPRYTVQAGDSLWSIAESFAQGGDPRTLIRLIQERNGVSASTLQSGQSLIIPVA